MLPSQFLTRINNLLKAFQELKDDIEAEVNKSASAVVSDKLSRESRLKIIVAGHFNIMTAQYKHKTKREPINTARQVLAYVLRTRWNYSLNQTRKVCGYTDKKSVIHAEKNINSRIELDHTFAAGMAVLIMKLESAKLL